MRLKITLDTKGQPVPFEYHGYLQGMIYHALNDDTAEQLHDRGYGDDRIYKLFVFSELSGKYVIKNRSLVFTEPVRFYVSSVSSEMLNELYTFFNENEEVRFGRNMFDVVSAEPVREFGYNENMEYRIRTISPITAYKTDEKNYTTYFNPKSADFENSLHDNLRRKYVTCYGEELSAEDDIFEILDVEKSSKRISKYKETNYNAYMCVMRVKVSDTYLKLLMHTGLGASNSAGYGMMCIMER